jgi:4-amino-4-deoxychorismate lyase
MGCFIETIKIKNRDIYNIDLHNLRLNNTISDNFGINSSVNLLDYIKVPDSQKVYRCRVEYSSKIEKIEYIEQKKREFKSFKIVQNDEIEYKYKSCNRDELNNLLLQKGDCDEIIIVKNGFITDTSISNIAIFSDFWYTPKEPLLMGTQRQKLLNSGLLREKNITIDELKNAKKIAILNALVEFYIIDEFYILD